MLDIKRWRLIETYYSMIHERQAIIKLKMRTLEGTPRRVPHFHQISISVVQTLPSTMHAWHACAVAEWLVKNYLNWRSNLSIRRSMFWNLINIKCCMIRVAIVSVLSLCLLQLIDRCTSLKYYSFADIEWYSSMIRSRPSSISRIREEEIPWRRKQ